MSQRRLLDDEDELPVRSRTRSGDGEVLALLEEMATIMHYRTDRGLKWYARAVGAKGGFSEADTAVEAMREAVAQRRQEKA